jgi:hypothetical protein
VVGVAVNVGVGVGVKIAPSSPIDGAGLGVASGVSARAIVVADCVARTARAAAPLSPKSVRREGLVSARFVGKSSMAPPPNEGHERPLWLHVSRVPIGGTSLCRFRYRGPRLSVLLTCRA